MTRLVDAPAGWTEHRGATLRLVGPLSRIASRVHRAEKEGLEAQHRRIVLGLPARRRSRYPLRNGPKCADARFGSYRRSPPRFGEFNLPRYFAAPALLIVSVRAVARLAALTGDLLTGVVAASVVAEARSALGLLTSLSRRRDTYSGPAPSGR